MTEKHHGNSAIHRKYISQETTANQSESQLYQQNDVNVEIGNNKSEAKSYQTPNTKHRKKK